MPGFDSPSPETLCSSPPMDLLVGGFSPSAATSQRLQVSNRLVIGGYNTNRETQVVLEPSSSDYAVTDGSSSTDSSTTDSDFCKKLLSCKPRTTLFLKPTRLFYSRKLVEFYS